MSNKGQFGDVSEANLDYLAMRKLDRMFKTQKLTPEECRKKLELAITKRGEFSKEVLRDGTVAQRKGAATWAMLPATKVTLECDCGDTTYSIDMKETIFQLNKNWGPAAFVLAITWATSGLDDFKIPLILPGFADASLDDVDSFVLFILPLHQKWEVVLFDAWEETFDPEPIQELRDYIQQWLKRLCATTEEGGDTPMCEAGDDPLDTMTYDQIQAVAGGSKAVQQAVKLMHGLVSSAGEESAPICTQVAVLEDLRVGIPGVTPRNVAPAEDELVGRRRKLYERRQQDQADAMDSTGLAHASVEETGLNQLKRHLQEMEALIKRNTEEYEDETTVNSEPEVDLER